MKAEEESCFKPGDLVEWKPLMGSSRGRIKLALVLGIDHGLYTILMNGQKTTAWDSQLRPITGGGQDDAE